MVTPRLLLDEERTVLASFPANLLALLVEWILFPLVLDGLRGAELFAELPSGS